MKILFKDESAMGDVAASVRVVTNDGSTIEVRAVIVLVRGADGGMYHAIKFLPPVSTSKFQLQLDFPFQAIITDSTLSIERE